MLLKIVKLQYHREETEILDLDQPQVLLMVSDIIRSNLAQSGVTCEVELCEE